MKSTAIKTNVFLLLVSNSLSCSYKYNHNYEYNDDDEDDDEDDEVFSGEGNYFRIADFIGLKLTFVITDAT